MQTILSPCLLKCSYMLWFEFGITSKLKVTSFDNQRTNVYCVVECKIEFKTIFKLNFFYFGLLFFDY